MTLVMASTVCVFEGTKFDVFDLIPHFITRYSGTSWPGAGAASSVSLCR